jgi:hypothetical protein
VERIIDGEGGTPTQIARSRRATFEIRPDFACQQSAYDPEARIAHAETQCACILLILNDLLWRRGWESDCVHPLKAKSLAEFDFIHIR